MNHQASVPLPVGHFVLGAAISIVVFAQGPLQDLIAVGIAAIAALLLYGGAARARATARTIARTHIDG